MSWFSDQVKRPWTISSPVTTALVRKEWRKPGGTFKKFTDWGAKLDHEAQMIAWGHSSYDKKTSAPPGSEEDLLRGSKRGIQGRSKNKKVGTEDERRRPYELGKGTLLTPGQTAKKLGPR